MAKSNVSNQMSVSDYRKLVGIKDPPKLTQAGLQDKKTMRTIQTTMEAPQVREIRFLLKLARIEFEEEYRFHETRKWRFDFAIPEKKIAIEYEGVFGKGKSRHTTVNGYTADAEKYNAAVADGWRVFRYTAKNYKNVIEDLNKIL